MGEKRKELRVRMEYVFIHSFFGERRFAFGTRHSRNPHPVSNASLQDAAEITKCMNIYIDTNHINSSPDMSGIISYIYRLLQSYLNPTGL